ncbi:TPA: hypothetical protein N0F65_003135 [Lagenidium giganteum]|uniref:Uncharacterized protein n=1 Tax=Lagenidium giganteum TaxID=4803 RepID=A0AAV2YHU1_9STRA|nr:TPA: hypothetical protein N0F65_003135 [Lagenidium giganteum]
MDDESEAAGTVEAPPVTVSPSVAPAPTWQRRDGGGSGRGGWSGGNNGGGWRGGGDRSEEVNRARMWTQDFAEGDGRLMRMKGATTSVGGQGSAAPGWWEPICEGLPFVMTKSNVVEPNGGCPYAQTKVNMSCTCITSMNTSSTWAFRLKFKASQPTSYPLTFDAANVLEVTTVSTLFLPPQVTTL